MLTLIPESDTMLLIFAVVGLVATFAAIVRDTAKRRRSEEPAVS